MLLGAYGGGALVGGIPGGFLVGKVGPKRGVLLGLAVLSLSSIAFALADGALALGVARSSRASRAQPPGPGRSPGSRSSTRASGAARRWARSSAWPCSASSSARCSAASRTRRHPSLVRAGRARRGRARCGAHRCRGAAPRGAEPGAIRRALRDRVFLAGLWLNMLPALFFGALDVLVPLLLDDAGHGAIAIAAVFVTAGLLEVVVNPVVGRVRPSRAPAPRPGRARRVDRRRRGARRRNGAARRRRPRGRRVRVVRRLLHAGHGARRRSRRACPARRASASA